MLQYVILYRNSKAQKYEVFLSLGQILIKPIERVQHEEHMLHL